MLIYLSFYSWSVFFTVLIYTINYSFLVNYSLSSNLLSFINRVYLNDFYLNNFYFMWTSLWYIPLYILITFILSHFRSRTITTKQKSLLVITLIFLTFTYLSYYNANLTYENVTYLAVDTNALLGNSVNKIHPLLLYISLLIFSNVLLNFYNSNLNRLQRNLFVLFTNLLLIKNRVLISIFTLFLGSWWALQEGSWGGWWNWDFSEVFGLFILIKLLTYTHFKDHQSSYLNNWFYILTSTVFILIFYLSIQLNFSYVSHNFGFRFYKFINSTIFFNYMLLMTFIFFFLINSNLKFYVTNIIITNKQLLIKLSITVLISIVCCAYLSLFVLVNDFIWNNFNTNLFNFQYNFNNLMLLLVIFLVTFLLKLRVRVILFLVINANLFLSFLFTLFKRLGTYNFVVVLHYSFLFIFFYSLIYFNELFSHIRVLNSTNILESHNVTFNLTLLSNTSNDVENSTTFDSKYFSLKLVKNELYQNFYPLGCTNFFCLCISDNIALFIFVNFIISYYFLIWKTNKLIMFK